MTDATPDTRILARSQWFARQSAELRAALMKRAHISELGPGQWIYGTGDALNGLYGVLSGSVHLLMTLAEGDTRLIDIVQAGQFFGQPARFGGGPRLVTAIAGEPTALLHVPDHALADIARREPDVWRNFTTLLYAQLAGALALAAATIHLPPPRRVAARLAMLAWNTPALKQRSDSASKESGRGSTAIEVRVTQSQLAELTGLSRKTVNFHLSTLARAQIISLHYRHIVVHDAHALRQRGGLA